MSPRLGLEYVGSALFQSHFQRRGNRFFGIFLKSSEALQLFRQVEHARRYADPNTYLIPGQDWPENRQEVIRLTGTPATKETRLREREAELQSLVERVETLHAEWTEHALPAFLGTVG